MYPTGGANQMGAAPASQPPADAQHQQQQNQHPPATASSQPTPTAASTPHAHMNAASGNNGSTAPVGSAPATGVAAPAAPTTASSASSAAAAPSSASSPSSSLPALSNPGEEAALESIVLAYLRRRGYTHTEEAWKQEQRLKMKAQAGTTSTASASTSAPAAAASTSTPPTAAPSSPPDIHSFSADLSLDQHTHLLKQILHYSTSECSPDQYAHQFQSLKRWLADCLDIYRQELHPVLWPLYAHCFIQLIHRGFPQEAHRFLSRYRSEHELLHRSELHVFQNIMTDSDLQKCEIIRWFLQRKVEVPMSSFSHQLLISFLEENQFFLLLKIVNEHLHIKVMSRKPLSLESESYPSSSWLVSSSLTSVSSSFHPLNPLAVHNLNTTPIRWGMLPELAEVHMEAAATLREKLKEQQIISKMERVKREKEERERQEEEKRRKEEEAKAAAAAAAAAAKDDDDDDGESAKKKAKTDGADGDAMAASSSGGDVDMADADSSQPTDTAAAAAAAVPVEKEKKSKKAKKKEPTSSPIDPLKETKEEKEAIERAVRKQIKVPEVMAKPKREDQQLKMPPMSEHTHAHTGRRSPPDARARYLSDLHSRHKLSSSSLPSICQYTFLNSLHTVNSIRMSTDGTLVSCGLSDSTVRLYDLRDPRVRVSTNPFANAEADGERKEEDGSAMLEQAIYADGQEGTGTVSTIGGSILTAKRFSDDNTMLPYSKLVGHSGPVYSTSLSPEGQYLLSASEDCTVRLWHLESKRNLVVYRGHNYPVWDVAFASLGYYFATASHDHTARLWATNHIAPLRMFVGHSSDVDVVKFHPNCNYVATGSSDATARLWDVQSGECVRVFVGHASPIRSLAMDPEGRYAATGGEDGRVVLWDLGSGKQVTQYEAHSGPVTALDYSADAEILASGSLDCSIRLMEPKKPFIRTPLRTYRTKRTPVNYLAFTPRNLLLSAGIFQP